MGPGLIDLATLIGGNDVKSDVAVVAVGDSTTVRVGINECEVEMVRRKVTGKGTVLHDRLVSAARQRRRVTPKTGGRASASARTRIFWYGP